MPTIQLSTASNQHRRWIFLAFLIALHLVFLQGPLSQLGRLQFLAHIGIGLLWQPFIQPKRRVGFIGTMVVILCSGVLAFALNWGLLIIWTMLLAGVVGGKVFLFPDRWERLFHLLGLGYLATVSFALLLPEFLQGWYLTESAPEKLVLYVAPTVFIMMALLPASRQPQPTEHAEIVDYIYGVMVFLLQAVIALGSISFALLFKSSYFESLMLTLAMVAAILLTLGLIWRPGSGFAGLGSAVVHHVMSLGMPFEGWLQFLAELGRTEQNPDRFLERACAELPARLPGVIGGRWQSHTAQASFGETGNRRVVLTFGQLKLELVTRVTASPVVVWHYDLACRLLAEYHMGKWRAEELQRMSYVEAIHETGARLTHDVKNLLQTLDTLCIAAEREGAVPSSRFNELLRRQLPEIASRLRQTLIKLSAPGKSEYLPPMASADWLAKLQNRFAGSAVHFEAPDDLASVQIADPMLFSSIAENLLQNALDKHRSSPGIAVEVRLIRYANLPAMEVCDTGQHIDPETAGKLFGQRIASENGLGVGLYQCAQMAASAGYRLKLAENRDGCVCFRLEANI